MSAATLEMSTSNFQWRHDGLRWRIKLMQGCTNFFREKMRFLRVAGLEKTIVIFGEE